MFSVTAIFIEPQDRFSSAFLRSRNYSTRPRVLVLLGILDCTVYYKLIFYSIIFIITTYSLLSKCIVNIKLHKSFSMALYSLHCADVPLRNCSVTHSKSKEVIGVGRRTKILAEYRQTGGVGMRTV